MKTKPYYEDNWLKIYLDDCREILTELEDNSIDLLVTDPPYGIGFMGKDWDTFNEIVEPQGAYQYKKGFKKLPRKKTASMTEFFVPIWTECLRVLKAGAFAFVMCSPRADVMARQICCLQDAGFAVNFTPIFWAYASGFPKAQNISLMIDKQECRKQLTEKLGRKPIKEEFNKAWKGFREVIGKHPDPRHKYPNTDITGGNYMSSTPAVRESGILTAPATPQAKALDGSYGGFQPKPAVEVIIVAMKPLSEKTFVDQALKNRKGITWLDDCRIPYESEGDKESARFGVQVDITGGNYGATQSLKKPQAVIGRNKLSSTTGRFPANLLVSDDVLNDGKIRASGTGAIKRTTGKGYRPNAYGAESRAIGTPNIEYGDSGSFSRYFDLDKWAQKTFPFLIVPKASKREKGGDNIHPTVKPLKLMAYLVTLGCRAGDSVVDPFMGSGTAGPVCQILNRKFIGIEIKEENCEIALNRCRQMVMDLSI